MLWLTKQKLWYQKQLMADWPADRQELSLLSQPYKTFVLENARYVKTVKFHAWLFNREAQAVVEKDRSEIRATTKRLNIQKAGSDYPSELHIAFVVLGKAKSEIIEVLVDWLSSRQATFISESCLMLCWQWKSVISEITNNWLSSRQKLVISQPSCSFVINILGYHQHRPAALVKLAQVIFAVPAANYDNMPYYTKSGM